MTSESANAAARSPGTGRRGPSTAAGKARSARNALKHGLRARVLVLLDDEDAADFADFAAAVQAELAPAGALEGDLVGRIVTAAWRARRADRLEAALLGRYLEDARPRGDAHAAQVALGYGLMRDGNGPRALETLVRYRGAVLAELFRSLARPRGASGPGPAGHGRRVGAAPRGRRQNRTNSNKGAKTETSPANDAPIGVMMRVDLRLSDARLSALHSAAKNQTNSRKGAGTMTWFFAKGVNRPCGVITPSSGTRRTRPA